MFIEEILAYREAKQNYKNHLLCHTTQSESCLIFYITFQSFICVCNKDGITPHIGICNLLFLLMNSRSTFLVTAECPIVGDVT